MAVHVPGTRDVRSLVNRTTLSHFRPLLPVALGLTLTAALAGGIAWSATGKTATVSVDGQPRQVDFRGGSVEDVLAAAGLKAGEHDLLVPSAGSPIDDGAKVALRRGRQIELVIDGRARTVWVIAASVGEALEQVGLRSPRLALSASRSRPIPLGGLSLAVTTPKDISIIADNAVKPVTTAKPTVRAALIEAGVALDGDDRLSNNRAERVTDRMVIRVVRVRTERSTEQVSVPFRTERREDSSAFTGQTKTLKAGKTGLMRRTIAMTYADGTLEKRAVVATQSVSAPVTRVLEVGTRPRPASPAGPQQSTAGADGLNWAALAECESGGNPRAVNPSGTYRGLYQFSIQTWRGVGGAGDPIDASSGEQTYRAKLLYQRSGAGQWPECGRRLFT